MTNIRVDLTYDGTSYFGWQKTASGPSIEEELKRALETILRHSVYLQAASRTDRGVHAKQQVVNFTTECTVDWKKLKYQLNCLLPKDIRITALQEAPPEFHPTLNAIEKTYVYRICLGAVQMPHDRLYAWHFPRPLDIQLIKEAATHFEGTHDFKAFTNHKENEFYEDTIRTIHKVIVTNLETELTIIISGKRFLYKMVRNIVGTLIYIGCKKLLISDINRCIIKQDRSLAGVTVPARGLTLLNIKY